MYKSGLMHARHKKCLIPLALPIEVPQAPSSELGPTKQVLLEGHPLLLGIKFTSHQEKRPGAK